MARDMSDFLERVELGDIEEVKSMLKKGEANIMEVDEWGTTALLVAALNNEYFRWCAFSSLKGVQISPRRICVAGLLY
jgi:hypothetical protein